MCQNDLTLWSFSGDHSKAKEQINIMAEFEKGPLCCQMVQIIRQWAMFSCNADWKDSITFQLTVGGTSALVFVCDSKLIIVSRNLIIILAVIKFFIILGYCPIQNIELPCTIQYLRNIVSPNNTTPYTLRDSEAKLNLPKPRTNYMKRAICCDGASLWNSLPPKIYRISLAYVLDFHTAILWISNCILCIF